MTAEGVEFSAADENELGDTEGGSAPGKCPHVVPFGYVVNHHIALHPHSPLDRDFSLSRRLESMSHNNTPQRRGLQTFGVAREICVLYLGY